MDATLMVNETNPIPDGYYENRGEVVMMGLKEFARRGGRITRVRWLIEAGRGDLSYVHGVLPDGTLVDLLDPGLYLIPRSMMKRALVDWAIREGVYGKQVGLLDESVWSVMW